MTELEKKPNAGLEVAPLKKFKRWILPVCYSAAIVLAMIGWIFALGWLVFLSQKQL